MPNCRVRVRVRLYRTALLGTTELREVYPIFIYVFFIPITLPQLYTSKRALCGLTLHKRSQVAQALSLQKIIVQRTP